jgi:hypothetical protein
LVDRRPRDTDRLAGDFLRDRHLLADSHIRARKSLAVTMDAARVILSV